MLLSFVSLCYPLAFLRDRSTHHAITVRGQKNIALSSFMKPLCCHSERRISPRPEILRFAQNVNVLIHGIFPFFNGGSLLPGDPFALREKTPPLSSPRQRPPHNHSTGSPLH